MFNIRNEPNIRPERLEQRPDPNPLKYDYKSLPNRLRQNLLRHKEMSRLERLESDLNYYKWELKQTEKSYNRKFFRIAIRRLRNEIKKQKALKEKSR